MEAQHQVTDLAIVGAGVAACSLVAALRQRGWPGSIVLLESGRGPGGRAATRRSRHDPALQINHGAPLFNLAADAELGLLAPLINRLVEGGWIAPFSGAIHSLDGAGQLGPRDPADPLTQGTLWQAQGGMDQLAAGLLALADPQRGTAKVRSNSLVRRLQPNHRGNKPTWSLIDNNGVELAESHWLVLSGNLLAHPRCQQVFGWDGVPLQQAAATLHDPQLDQTATALASIEATSSSNLLLVLPPELTEPWQAQPWRLLQFTPAAQQRWGLRRVSLQAQADGRWAVVAESSAAFAEHYRHVYGARSSAAQVLGAPSDPGDEAAVIDALDQALQDAIGLPTTGAERQLMRWAAAFPQPPGLPPELQLCPDSRVGLCGDYVATGGFGRIEGAIASAIDLAAKLLPLL